MSVETTFAYRAKLSLITWAKIAYSMRGKRMRENADSAPLCSRLTKGTTIALRRSVSGRLGAAVLPSWTVVILAMAAKMSRCILLAFMKIVLVRTRARRWARMRTLSASFAMFKD
jgi:hypothetical protein